MRNVDLRSRPPAEFRLGIFHHVKFLNGVGRQQHRLLGSAGGVPTVNGRSRVVGHLVGHAIEHVNVVLPTQAVRITCDGPGVRPRPKLKCRKKPKELNILMTGQGKVAKGASEMRTFQLRVSRGNGRRFSRDCNGLGLFAGLQRNVHVHIAADP